MKKSEAQKIIDAMLADEAKEKELRDKFGIVSKEYLAFIKSPEHRQVSKDFLSVDTKNIEND